MKYATALRQLTVVAEEATSTADVLRSLDTVEGEPLRELWLGGELLEGPDEVEASLLVLVMDEPVEELPWRAVYPSGAWLADRMRLTKMPIRWYVRPAGYPAWNPEMRAALRFWTAGDAG